jgi:hypothetical protein
MRGGGDVTHTRFLNVECKAANVIVWYKGGQDNTKILLAERSGNGEPAWEEVEMQRVNAPPVTGSAG